MGWNGEMNAWVTSLECSEWKFRGWSTHPRNAKVLTVFQALSAWLLLNSSTSADARATSAAAAHTVQWVCESMYILYICVCICDPQWGPATCVPCAWICRRRLAAHICQRAPKRVGETDVRTTAWEIKWGKGERSVTCAVLSRPNLPMQLGMELFHWASALGTVRHSMALEPSSTYPGVHSKRMTAPTAKLLPMRRPLRGSGTELHWVALVRGTALEKHGDSEAHVWI